MYSESEIQKFQIIFTVYTLHTYLQNVKSRVQPDRAGPGEWGGESGRQAGEAAGDRSTTGVSGTWARGEGDEEAAGDRDKDQPWTRTGVLQGKAGEAAGDRGVTGGPGWECRAVKQRATGAAQVDPVKSTPGNDRREWSSRYASGSNAQWLLAGWLVGWLPHPQSAS